MMQQFCRVLLVQQYYSINSINIIGKVSSHQIPVRFLLSLLQVPGKFFRKHKLLIRADAASVALQRDDDQGQSQDPEHNVPGLRSLQPNLSFCDWPGSVRLEEGGI